MSSSTYGPNIELARANRRYGPMYWDAAEFANIGPIVRARQILDDGSRSQWETIAIALDPGQYMAALTRFSRSDVVIGRR